MSEIESLELKNAIAICSKYGYVVFTEKAWQEQEQYWHKNCVQKVKAIDLLERLDIHLLQVMSRDGVKSSIQIDGGLTADEYELLKSVFELKQGESK